MARSLLLSLTLLAGLTTAVPAAAAHAGQATAAPSPAATVPGVVVFFGTGEQIFDLGPLPKRYRKQDWLSGYRMGLRCKIFTLFWAYVHRWKCKPAVYRGETFYKASLSSKAKADQIQKLHAHIEKKYTLKDVKLGFWALNGRWVLAGIVVLLILIAVIKKVRS